MPYSRCSKHARLGLELRTDCPRPQDYASCELAQYNYVMDIITIRLALSPRNPQQTPMVVVWPVGK